MSGHRREIAGHKYLISLGASVAHKCVDAAEVIVDLDPRKASWLVITLMEGFAAFVELINISHQRLDTCVQAVL